MLFCVVLWEFEPAEGAQNTMFVNVQEIDVMSLATFSRLTVFRISLRTRRISQVDSVYRAFFFLNPNLRSRVGSLSLYTVYVFKNK